jgi:SET domain-containing protein
MSSEVDESTSSDFDFPLWDDISDMICDDTTNESVENTRIRRTAIVMYRNNIMNPIMEVRESNIKHISYRFPWGTFTLIGIPYGVVIVEYKGERITNEIRLFRYKGILHSSGQGRYVFDNEDGSFTDGENPLLSGIARFINSTGPGEDTEANVEVFSNDGRLYVRAIKYIHPGQELLYDYGDDYKWDDGEHKSVFTKLIPRRKVKQASTK